MRRVNFGTFSICDPELRLLAPNMNTTATFGEHQNSRAKKKENTINGPQPLVYNRSNKTTGEKGEWRNTEINEKIAQYLAWNSSSARQLHYFASTNLIIISNKTCDFNKCTIKATFPGTLASGCRADTVLPRSSSQKIFSTTALCPQLPARKIKTKPHIFLLSTCPISLFA
jgi:hypothetical protein